MTDAQPLFELETPQRFHITNVGGAGMSAVAAVLAEMGHRVTGHDPIPESPFLEHLRSLGVIISTGEAAELPTTDSVIVSTATPADHPHVVAARAAGIPVHHRARALGSICELRPTLAVAGTHGKTTTSALLATILHEAGKRPGWIVGARVVGLGSNGSWGGGGPLVVEADESDGSFLAISARAAVVTNVEADHLDYWGDEATLRDGFERFAAAIPDSVVLCGDDPGSAALAARTPHPVSYGTSAGADYLVADIATERTGVRFTITHAGESVAVVVPAAPGRHNALNAAAAIAAANRLGVGLTEAAVSLGRFRGVARRFELRGEAAGVTLVDSYDHLPSEVEAALEAARAGGWDRVVCCFQPHRYSRTEALGAAFADSFADADLLAITDIYPAGEAPREGVDGKLVVDAVLDAHPWKRVAWLPSLDDVVTYLASSLRPGDLCLTLGAGDLTTVPDRVLSLLDTRSRG